MVDDLGCSGKECYRDLALNGDVVKRLSDGLRGQAGEVGDCLRELGLVVQPRWPIVVVG